MGNISEGIRTRSSYRNIENQFSLISTIESKTIEEAIENESWIETIQEELNQFKRNNVWTLEPKPKDKSIIGTKWVFRNKLDENKNVVRNKARLVAKGYSQGEWINYDETFTPVVRLEAIRLLLPFACFKDF